MHDCLSSQFLKPRGDKVRGRNEGEGKKILLSQLGRRGYDASKFGFERCGLALSSFTST